MATKMKNMIMKNMNRRGQVTIFIILGLILVVIIVMLFLLIRGPDVEISDEENPQAFIDTCTSEAVEEVVEILLKNAGDLEPKNSVLYLDKEITYLCYTNKNLEKCVAEETVLIMHMETEITNYIKPRIENCFNKLKGDFEGRYDIEIGEMELTTQLQPTKVVVNIDRDFKMVRGDNIRQFDNFKINLLSPIYDLGEIAIKIIDSKAKSCEFDYINHMILYPKYDILFEKTNGEDDVEIYTIIDLTTQKQFKFATRGCVIPPGLKG